MMKAKIKTSFIDVEYEGTQEFFKDDFMPIVEALETVAC